MGKAIGVLDMQGREIRNALKHLLTGDPTGAEGLDYFNTATDRYKIHNGTTWKNVAWLDDVVTLEDLQDNLGNTFIVNGAGLSKTYSDGSDTLTLAVTDSPLLGGQNSAYHLDRNNHSGTQLAASISNLAATVKAYRLDEFAVPTAAVSFNNFKITGLADGTNPGDAVNFGQLNAIVQGQEFKTPVVVATTANITLSGTQTIDTIAVVAGDRVLVKNQSTPSQNGIWIVAAGAWTRATDMDVAAEFTRGTVLVRGGATHQGDIFTQTATVVTVNTDTVTFVQTGEGNTTYAADGVTLQLVGTTFSIKDGGIDLSSAKIGSAALLATKGGTGQTGYAVGDLLYASTTTALSKLVAAAAGNVLISGTTPSWGKVALATHVSGQLPVANGGTAGTTPATARAGIGAVGIYSVAIGNGSATTFNITHSLNNTGAVPHLKETSTGEWINIFDYVTTGADTGTLTIVPAPSASQYTLVMIG